MLRKDYKNIQEQSVKFKQETIEKASKAGLHWVLCLWESPLSPCTVNQRVGYFEDVNEAEHMKEYLKGIYTNYKFPYYLKTSYGETIDGGLFDD